MRASLLGQNQNIETLTTGGISGSDTIGTPYGITLDALASKVYWMQAHGMWSFDLATSTRSQVFNTGVSSYHNNASIILGYMPPRPRPRRR